MDSLRHFRLVVSALVLGCVFAGGAPAVAEPLPGSEPGAQAMPVLPSLGPNRDSRWLRQHATTALRWTTAAYVLEHERLPETVADLAPYLMFADELQDLLPNPAFPAETFAGEDMEIDPRGPRSLHYAAALVAREFMNLVRKEHFARQYVPISPEFRLALQTALLLDAMRCAANELQRSPINLAELAFMYGGINEAGWTNPYTGAPMRQLVPRPPAAEWRAGDFACFRGRWGLVLTLFREHPERLVVPVAIHFAPFGGSLNDQYVFGRRSERTLMITVTEPVPGWQLPEVFQ